MFENLSWQGASVIISIVLVIGKLLVDFLSGKYTSKDKDKDARTDRTKDNLRVADEKWKTHVDESLSTLEAGQINLNSVVVTFKSQMHTDIKGIHKRIDDFFKHLTERIDTIKQ